MLTNLMNLFYPHCCEACGLSLTNSERYLCLSCFGKLPSTNFLHWPENPVAKMFYGRVDLKMASATYYYHKDSILQRLVHRFKYKETPHLAVWFGKCMGEQFLEAGIPILFDAIVPMPLHPQKYKVRGYNQAEELARGLALKLQLPLMADYLRRKSYNNSQTRKGRVDRWENVEGIFEVRDHGTASCKHVLLIDDVVTTGATMESAAQALLPYVDALSIVCLGVTA